MRATAVLLMLFSGLCFLPACFPLRYILVEKAHTWPEAQSYCREKYMDLAPVHTEEDLANLNTLTDESPDVWIGLQAEPESIGWSLEDPDYYGPGEADFRNWEDPNTVSASSGLTYWKLCTKMMESGKWVESACGAKEASVCYDKNAEESFKFIATKMTWDEARNYCRANHTDLASVRNQAENEQVNILSPDISTWLGLYRDGWKWSDGDAVSFTNWAPNAPNNDGYWACGASRSGQWVNDYCDNKKPFVCSVVPPPAFTETRRVKVVVSRSDSSVDMEELQAGILEEFNRRVKELGLSGSVKLRWTKQPDGKIFHKQEEEEEEEEEEDGQSCPHK